MAKYRDIVNRVVSLDSVKGKKIAMKLTRLLNEEWNETMFEFGAYVLSWRLVLVSITLVLKIVEVGLAETTCRELVDKLEQLLASREPSQLLLGWNRKVVGNPSVALLQQYWRRIDLVGSAVKK